MATFDLDALEAQSQPPAPGPQVFDLDAVRPVTVAKKSVAAPQPPDESSFEDVARMAGGTDISAAPAISTPGPISQTFGEGMKETAQKAPWMFPMLGAGVLGAAAPAAAATAPAWMTPLITGILQGAGAFGGEMGRQKLAGEEMDVKRGLTEGGVTAAIPPLAGYGVSPLLKLAAKYTPGVAVPMQRFADVVAGRATAGLPRPETAEAFAARTGQAAAASAEDVATRQAAAEAAAATANSRNELLDQAVKQTLHRTQAREAGELVRELPKSRGDYATYKEATDAISAMQALGGVEEVTPTNLSAAIEEGKRILTPFMEKWKMHPSEQMRQSIATLGKWMEGGAPTNVNTYKEFLQDIGPQIAGETGPVRKVLGSLYAAAERDLAAGGPQSTALREGQQVYKRGLALGKLESAVGKATSIKGGETVFNPDAVAQQLTQPRTATQARDAKRLLQSLSMEERQLVLDKFQSMGRVQAGLKSTPKVKAEKITAGEQPTETFENVQALQDMIQQPPLRGSVRGYGQTDADKVLELLPVEGVPAKNKITAWMATHYSPEQIANLRETFTKLARFPSIPSTTQSTWIERIPFLAAMSATGIVPGIATGGAAGGAMGVGGILLAALMAEGAGKLAATKTGGELLQRAFLNQIGRGAGTRALATATAGAAAPSQRAYGKLRSKNPR